MTSKRNFAALLLSSTQNSNQITESFDKKQTHMLSDGNIFTISAERFLCE